MSKANKSDINNNFIETSVSHPHDKMLRKLLSDKKDTALLLNSYFGFEKMFTEDELENYSAKFVNTHFQIRESDTIYKLKDKDIFFLIEHQSRIDYNMSRRIAEYQIGLMKLENANRNSKKIVIPLIIPLVIYTDNSYLWNAKKTIEENQPVLEGYKNLGLGGYDVLDINTFKTEELLNNSLFIYRFLCIEKSNSTEELAKNLYYLISSETDEKHLNFLKEIIQYIFRKELKFNDFCKLMENIKDKKDTRW